MHDGPGIDLNRSLLVHGVLCVRHTEARVPLCRTQNSLSKCSVELAFPRPNKQANGRPSFRKAPQGHSISRRCAAGSHTPQTPNRARTERRAVDRYNRAPLAHGHSLTLSTCANQQHVRSLQSLLGSSQESSWEPQNQSLSQHQDVLATRQKSV